MEEIDLTSNDDITNFTDEENIDINEVNIIFTQVNKLRGETREFTIFNNIQCYQAVKKKYARKRKFRVNLTYLDHQLIRKYHLASDWLISTVIMALVSFLVISIGWFSKFHPSPNIMIVLSSICITLFFLLLFITLLKSHNRILLYSKYGRVPILELINNNPDKLSFKNFIRMLSGQILKAQNTNQTIAQILPMELKELRRLMDEAVITADSYENAKKLIFQNKSFSSETT